MTPLDMKAHPSPEQWMAFMYGEDSPDEHRQLDEHLQACAACRRQIGAWRDGMRALDEWTLPAPHRRVPVRRALRWAAAAAVVLGVGLVLGRISSTSASDPQKLQAGLRAYVDRQLETSRREWGQLFEQRQSELAQNLRAAAASAASEEARHMFAQYASNLEDQLETDHQTILAAFRQLDERRRTDITALREDIQTVAVNADDGLARAQEQLLDLASSKSPDLP